MAPFLYKDMMVSVMQEKTSGDLGRLPVKLGTPGLEGGHQAKNEAPFALPPDFLLREQGVLPYHAIQMFCIHTQCLSNKYTKTQ